MVPRSHAGSKAGAPGPLGTGGSIDTRLNLAALATTGEGYLRALSATEPWLCDGHGAVAGTVSVSHSTLRPMFRGPVREDPPEPQGTPRRPRFRHPAYSPASGRFRSDRLTETALPAVTIQRVAGTYRSVETAGEVSKYAESYSLAVRRIGPRSEFEDLVPQRGACLGLRRVRVLFAPPAS